MCAPHSSASALGATTLALAVALGAVSASRRANANPMLQGVGDTSLGYTDNIQSAPSVPIPGGEPRSGGVFLILSPGVVLASASARAIHRLKYTYTYEVFFQPTM